MPDGSGAGGTIESDTAAAVLGHLRASPLAHRFALPEQVDLASEDAVEPLAGHLLQLFRTHDDGLAFELLVEITQEHLWRQAARLARQLAVILDPDDLVAGFVARLFTDVRRDQPVVHRFFGMSYRTMRFEALNQLRLDRRARKRGETWESMKALQQHRVDPAELAADREDTRVFHRLGLLVTALVGQAFHGLDRKDRQVLWHREIEGLDYDALAAAMCKPRAQIGMVLKRARDRLGRRLESALRAHAEHVGPAVRTARGPGVAAGRRAARPTVHRPASEAVA